MKRTLLSIALGLALILAPVTAYATCGNAAVVAQPAFVSQNVLFANVAVPVVAPHNQLVAFNPNVQRVVVRQKAQVQKVQKVQRVVVRQPVAQRVVVRNRGSIVGNIIRNQQLRNQNNLLLQNQLLQQDLLQQQLLFGGRQRVLINRSFQPVIVNPAFGFNRGFIRIGGGSSRVILGF